MVLVVVYFRLVEQSGNLYFLGLVADELLLDMVHRYACVDNVLDNNYGSVLDVLVHADKPFNLASRVCALVRSKFQERNIAVDGKVVEQFGGKHERAVKYSKEEWILVAKVAVHFFCHLLDFRNYGFVVDVGNELPSCFLL